MLSAKPRVLKPKLHKNSTRFLSNQTSCSAREIVPLPGFIAKGRIHFIIFSPTIDRASASVGESPLFLSFVLTSAKIDLYDVIKFDLDFW